MNRISRYYVKQSEASGGANPPANTPVNTDPVVFNPFGSAVPAATSIPTPEELTEAGLDLNSKAMCVRITATDKYGAPNTPEALYEHARAAIAVNFESVKDCKHAIILLAVPDSVRGTNSKGKETKQTRTRILAVYDIASIEPFGENHVAQFTIRKRDSFCKPDGTTLLEKRVIFTGTLNEKATRKMKGLYWSKPVPMFWHVSAPKVSDLITGNSHLQMECPPYYLKEESVASVPAKSAFGG